METCVANLSATAVPVRRFWLTFLGVAGEMIGIAAIGWHPRCLVPARPLVAKRFAWLKQGERAGQAQRWRVAAQVAF